MNEKGDPEKGDDDATLQRYDQINQQLKDFASLIKTYPSVIEDYKTYYTNKSIENQRQLNNLNRQIQDSLQNVNSYNDDKIVNNVKSSANFQGLLKVIRILEKEIKQTPGLKNTQMSEQ
jgi:hypothetical protein